MVKEFVSAVSNQKAPDIKKMPAPQEVYPTTPMPDLEEQQRVAMREEMKRKQTGRSSTNLVDEDEDNL